MCGIAGIYNINNAPASVESLQKMLSLMVHRGPDDDGTYLDGSLMLGFRRLAIIDLSPTGHQPMANEDGSVWVVNNGEIYNYIDLRDTLERLGHRFRSRSDTEVILHAYEEYGMKCLEHLNGMWGMAIWDKRKRRLFCARDRLGIKPFHYVFNGQNFLFSSEIKPLLAVMDAPRKPNERLIFDFVANSMNDHTEETFFVGVNKLLPGHYLIVDANGMSKQKYWSLEVDPAISHLSDADAAASFYDLFVDSVRLQMQSEVPLGTCLSGGLDSSSISCVINDMLINNRVNRDIIGEYQKTFSARFPEHPCDEGSFMEEVVKQINADDHYVYPQWEDLFNDGLKMLWHQEEPIPGTSYYAQWCVMRLAKEKGVTVLLDGEGPDEMLGGYVIFWPSYWTELVQQGSWIQLMRELGIAKQYGHWPVLKSIRPLLSCLARDKLPGSWIELSRRVRGLPEKYPPSWKAMPWLNDDFCRMNEHSFDFPPRWQENMTQHLHRYLIRDHLPGLLRHKDRASMAFSIEARVPFLDHRLVTFVHSLSIRQKMRDGFTKVVLRNAMADRIPKAILQRRDKIGFGTPEDDWFRTVLYKQTQDILESDSFQQRGYFNAQEVKRHLSLYRNGTPAWGFTPWTLVILELWLRMFIDDDPTKNIMY